MCQVTGSGPAQAALVGTLLLAGGHQLSLVVPYGAHPFVRIHGPGGSHLMDLFTNEDMVPRGFHPAHPGEPRAVLRCSDEADRSPVDLLVDPVTGTMEPLPPAPGSDEQAIAPGT